ncbi:sulfate permease [Rubrobacter tropicus]|uniref:Sulfate permease n=1 Tax=Rubrobacter tropicus TaxID=2653851 RepID=A0A6G8QES1_9ACTN|nr:solute carrier family 26 protein [Rubrobacter tropicus]QIN84737.1 sulfate permease [Rubrobacter tropicus]
MLEKIIPAAGWLRRYRREDLAGDLSAGLIVAVMLVPQGMAYAMLAGLPPVFGLYSSIMPLFVYALFGSSRQLAVGPVAIVSLLTLSGVSAVAEPGSGEFVALAALLALMVGVIQFGLGLVRAGFVVNFLSHAVVSGFTSAAAVVIGLSQLGPLLGVKLEAGHSVLAQLWEAGGRLAEVNPVTLAIGVGSIAALVLFKKISPRFPAPLLVVAASALAVYAFGLEGRGVGIVGEVPGGLPGLSVPALDPGSVVALIPTALTIAFVGFMESIAVAKSIAAKGRYEVDANRELVGLGLANVFGSAFSAYPVTGGFSRSAVNYAAGARTPLASVITAGLVLLTLVLFTPLFYYLPDAVLAVIVMVAVYGLIDAGEPVRLFKVKRADGWALVVTFAVTLLVGIEQGIVVGVAFSLLVFVWRSARPHTTEVGYLPEEDVFRNVNRYPKTRTFPGAFIVRVDASLYFANMAFLKNWLEDAVSARPGLSYLILDFSAVNDVDAVAIETLAEFAKDLRSRGIMLHVAGMKGPVRDVVARSGWPDGLGQNASHLSVKHALRHLDLWPEPNVARLPTA